MNSVESSLYSHTIDSDFLNKYEFFFLNNEDTSTVQEYFSKSNVFSKILELKYTRITLIIRAMENKYKNMKHIMSHAVQLCPVVRNLRTV